MESTTPTILQQVAAGRAGAVDRCLDAYGDLVWSLALRRFRDRSEAEEAVQDVFVDLWKHAGRFDPERAEEATFVAMIARRRLIDRLRRCTRALPTEPLERDGETMTAEIAAALADDPVDRIEAGVEMRRVVAAMKELDDGPRRVLWLAAYHGWSHRAIAESTGLPLGTVKTWVRRGLLEIREALGGRARTAREAS